MSKISTTAAIPPDDQKCPEARGHSPDELSCAICTDIYKDPKLLHCMHSFCGACIEKMKHQEDEKPSVVCPICRFVTKGDVNGTFQLWRNHILEQKVKWHQLSVTRENNSLQCSVCESEVATKLCSDCPSMKLCEDCSTHHKRCKKFKDHSIMDIEGASNDELLEDEVLKCPQHVRELGLHCRTCSVRACVDCVVSVHKDHSFRSLEQVMVEKVNNLDKILQESETVCQEYEEHFQKMEYFHKNAAEVRDGSRKEIDAAFTVLVNVLMAQKQKLFDWMDKDEESSTDALKNIKERLSHVRSMGAYLKDIKLHPKNNIYDIVDDGVSLLKTVTGDMGEAIASGTPKHGMIDNSQKLKRGDDNRNDFDVSLTSRRVKESDLFADVKSSLEQIASFVEDNDTDSDSDPDTEATHRLDRGFKFIESLFPQQTGVVTFEAKGLSGMKRNVLSPAVRIGDFLWRIKIQRDPTVTLEQDEKAGWFLCCDYAGGYDEFWMCHAALNLIIKNQSGGEDFKTFTPITTKKFNEDRGGKGKFFSKTDLTVIGFKEQGLIMNDSMIVQANINILSWEFTGMRKDGELVSPTSIFDRIRQLRVDKQESK